MLIIQLLKHFLDICIETHYHLLLRIFSEIYMFTVTVSSNGFHMRRSKTVISPGNYLLHNIFQWIQFRNPSAVRQQLIKTISEDVTEKLLNE